MLRKHWTNQDVYRRDLPVSIIKILIGQHGVFPPRLIESARMDFQP